MYIASLLTLLRLSGSRLDTGQISWTQRNVCFCQLLWPNFGKQSFRYLTCFCVQINWALFSKLRFGIEKRTMYSTLFPTRENWQSPRFWFVFSLASLHKNTYLLLLFYKDHQTHVCNWKKYKLKLLKLLKLLCATSTHYKPPNSIAQSDAIVVYVLRLKKVNYYKIKYVIGAHFLLNAKSSVLTSFCILKKK